MSSAGVVSGALRVNYCFPLYRLSVPIYPNQHNQEVDHDFDRFPLYNRQGTTVTVGGS